MSKVTKNKFDVICNTVDNGIIVLNKNLEIFFWNKWLEARTGLESNNIIGKNILDFYSNIDEKKLKRKILTALKLNSPTFYTPQTNDYLINIELNNISDKVFNQMQQSITITPLDTENELVILYIYDITFLTEVNYKLEIAKQELCEKNEELSLILDTTMEAIIIFKDDKVVDCNKIAIELLAKESKEKLLSNSFNEILYNLSSFDIVDEKPIETILTRDNAESFSALVNIKDAFINNKTFKILTIVDIEDIKRKESILAEQTKLAAMGEMLANIAHQWRQPLNIISISASNLKLKNDIEASNCANINESLSLILKTTEHLSNTIDTFHNFLKIDKDKSIFSINETINDSLYLLNSLLDSLNIEVILDLDEDCSINGIKNEFSQALINIINNAKDAINQNLRIDEPRLIKICTKKSENIIQISIIDNALGIQKNIIDKIFEPYFTTKHSYQGTGLGLYMTHKIIQDSLKGEIKVKNCSFMHKENKFFGANFTIKINTNLD